MQEVKENGTEIRLVGDNSYEMLATDEQLEKLARVEAELKAWEDALNESLDEREEREARQKELKEKNKWSTKKKVIVFGLIFFVLIGLPIIEGYQDSKLVEEGTPLNAEVVGRHVEKGFMVTHPTLVVEVDGKKHNVWVSEKTYNEAQWLVRLKVIKTKDGKVERGPRYEDEDLITRY
ncbi:hypothetical protein [Bacillus paramycoides]|uniref:Uncharacterized protein n=1 Tax=Bacillus paramycoides TaxID=2026194 RepID=A0A1J9UBR0_9BACI|nr:hypothetical protein [Bacillus paramycoides]OJD76080.1 hypothetical protein BAU28_16465 [Bacillus paramycoides]